MLVLCTGHSLESRFAAACSSAHARRARPWPTFALALAVLEDPHWSAVTAAGPLRYWQLVSRGRRQPAARAAAPRRADPGAYLIGVPAIDERLAAAGPPGAATSPRAGSADSAAAVRAGSRALGDAPLARRAAAAHRLEQVRARQAAFTAICQRSGLRAVRARRAGHPRGRRRARAARPAVDPGGRTVRAPRSTCAPRTARTRHARRAWLQTTERAGRDRGAARNRGRAARRATSAPVRRCHGRERTGPLGSATSVRSRSG